MPLILWQVPIWITRDIVLDSCRCWMRGEKECSVTEKESKVQDLGHAKLPSHPPYESHSRQKWRMNITQQQTIHVEDSY